jgi:hypothetical protein
LPESARHETHVAFIRRVDEDYATARRVIEQNIGGGSVAGYAFAYSEAGQSGGGNVADAWRVNLFSIRTYYRFGFIQDDSGYNGFDEQQPAPCILRRFKVPNNWSDSELLDHLEQRYPPHRLAMERAKRSYAAGQYTHARAAFKKLTGKAPAMDREVYYHLAAIDYQHRKYHSAARNMAKIDLPPDVAHNTTMRHQFALKRKIQWMTSARLTPQYADSVDSDERRTRTISLRLDYPVENEMNLWTTGGRTEFTQSGQIDIVADELTVGMDWHSLPELNATASARLRNMHEDGDSTNGWLSLKYGKARHHIQAIIAREDVDTLQARRDDIIADKFALNYTRKYRNSWIAGLSGGQRNLSDGNRRRDILARIAHPVPAVPKLIGGIDLAYRDTEMSSDAYYTLQDLDSVYLSGGYHVADDRWKLHLKAGVGMVKEAERSPRLGGYCGLNLERQWRERWKIYLKLDYSNSSTYHRETIYLGISYRFCSPLTVDPPHSIRQDG